LGCLGSTRVNINGFPHLEHGGRKLVDFCVLSDMAVSFPSPPAMHISQYRRLIM
jgi:hypothetical protein